jgi:hypothetical protein
LTYIPDNWILSIKTFLNKFNAKIEINDIWTPKLLRQHDKILMDKVEKLEITPMKKQIINNWRLYFQVLTISDLTNCKGDIIRQEFIEKRRAINYEQKKSKLRWPIQQAPSEKTFHIWIATIRNICNCNQNNELRPKLGNWKVNPIEYINHKYWTTKQHDILVSKSNNDTWVSHTPIENKRGRAKYDKFEVLPIDEIDITKLVPVDCNVEEDMIWNNKRTSYVEISKKHAEVNEIPKDLNKFKTYMKTESKKEPGRVTISLLNVDTIVEVTDESTIEICSDGGVRDGKGGYGFVMSVDQKIAQTGRSRIRNTFNEPTSYRAEAVGIMGAMRTYNRVQRFFSLGIITCGIEEKRLIYIATTNQ